MWRPGPGEGRALIWGGGGPLGTPVKAIYESLFGPGTVSPGDEIQEKLQVVDQATQKKDDTTRNSKVTTRVQKARTGCAQTSGPEGEAGDGIFYLNSHCGRVCHGAGTGLGGLVKLILGGGRSAEKNSEV